MGDWYTREILDPGKQPLLVMLVAFIVTFLFIRFSVRMIRAEVSWWPKNVESGGLHIHHVVFGMVFAVVAGIGLASALGGHRPWSEIFAGLFGVGIALVLDEFALVLRLEDVYWSEAGRLSVDAVVLGAAAMGLLVLGAAPFGVSDASANGEPVSGWHYLVLVLVNGGLALVALAKGKVFTGLLGMLVPVFAVVGALRLARPGSLWAYKYYREGSAKARRAQRREERGSWARRLRVRLYDAIAGKPSQP
ncbi:hypothetical protein C7C46_31790 [Streptomyces tateyamensis]|uniref:Integral membrane protein n=1 Tax=Streptomyces tateyamensis TaxID=565073 RepID=A0A2V4N7D5_9ACTN|nr:hypothetical protein [Streptomyces tateyamensis]PYC66075.1 hypothetical protein C7C46_31790 [Streptomyces tateyamensis]